MACISRNKLDVNSCKSINSLSKKIKYKDLVESGKVSPHENQIKLDVPRTFSNNRLFSQDSITR